MITGLIPYRGSNRLIAKWLNPKTGRVVVQGKRVGKDCPLTAEERRALITHGPARVVAMIRDRLGCSLREAKDLYDSAK